jgi:hypothetical protein
VDYVTGIMPILEGTESGFKFKQAGRRKIIPMRSIILGGDDITFVSDGRLGLHLAERFITLWTEKTKELHLTACGGVAIVRSKFPFFRAYTLAEELCSKAKEMARAREGTSWIDFHNVYGGFSTGVNEVRRLQYMAGNVSLHGGPYILSQKEDYRSIENFKKGLATLSEKNRWPRSKVKDMRSALAKGEAAARRFFE